MKTDTDFEATIDLDGNSIEVYVEAEGEYEGADPDVGIMSGGFVSAAIKVTIDGVTIDLPQSELDRLEQKAIENLNEMDQYEGPEYGDD